MTITRSSLARRAPSAPKAQNVPRSRRAGILLLLSLLSLLVLPARAVEKPRGESGPLPEPVKFWVVFRHLTALEAEAEKLERRGRDGSALRSVYRGNARLSDEQAARLSSIAKDCVARVEAKDREAVAIIRAARAAAPGGRWAKSETPPPPPVVLETLERERDGLILTARENLRRALGDEEFARFQSFVDHEVAPRIRTQSAAPAGGAI